MVLTDAEAVERACLALSLPASAPAKTWRVRRLDRPSEYVIVEVADHTACIDAASGALMLSARYVPTLLSAEAAKRCVGAGPDAVAELVWKPCAVSQSPFDAIWLISDHGQAQYVDQRGRPWASLEPKRPGG